MNVVGFLVGAYGGLHRSTTLVAKDDDQRSLEMLDSVLDAADHGVVDDIAGHSNYKQITESLVENDLGADARIRAP